MLRAQPREQCADALLQGLSITCNEKLSELIVAGKQLSNRLKGVGFMVDQVVEALLYRAQSFGDEPLLIDQVE